MYWLENCLTFFIFSSELTATRLGSDFKAMLDKALTKNWGVGLLYSIADELEGYDKFLRFEIIVSPLC